MAQAGNTSMTELVRGAALDQAKIYAQSAIIGAYKVGAGIGGPVLGAAYAAAASLATGAIINAIRGGGDGGSAPAVAVSDEATARTQDAESVAEVSRDIRVVNVSEDSILTGRALVEILREATGDNIVLEGA